MIFSFLHGYVHKVPQTMTYLSTHKIYSMPAINVDGFYEIDRIFKEQHKLEYIRKNMNTKAAEGLPCKGLYEAPGVDLNRNYGLKFGLDEIGSSSNPCDEQYRGKSAFSEPEVKALDTYLKAHRDIKVAINLHSWGNLLIVPYNYDDNWKNPHLLKDPYNLAYEDVRKNAGLPEGNLYGSGI